MINNELDQIRNSYFIWLYNYVCKGRISNTISYEKLFRLLFNTEFKVLIRSDINRASDGIELRYRYSLVKHDETINNILIGPCNLLEMIIALAVRCEETIMDDPRYGDRTNQWFWGMITNLGLAYMSDDNFNLEKSKNKINIFLEREYTYDGIGGLFYIKNTSKDLREVDIWTQLCWYLNNFN